MKGINTHKVKKMSYSTLCSTLLRASSEGFIETVRLVVDEMKIRKKLS